MHGLVARHLGTHETRLQSRELIFNLLASRIECSRERGIDRLELLSQTIKLVIDVLLGVRKQLRSVSAEMLFDDALHHRLESFKEICERQIVSFEHAPGVALDHAQTRTRQDRRWRAAWRGPRTQPLPAQYPRRPSP